MMRDGFYADAADMPPLRWLRHAIADDAAPGFSPIRHAIFASPLLSAALAAVAAIAPCRFITVLRH